MWFHGGVVRISVDFEHRSRTWWESGGQQLWDGLADGFDGSSVVVDEDIAASWIAAARRIAGWDDGPDYAPHPISVRSVAEDEPVA